eukprot:3934704-Rhodomonas_salina.1
MLRLLVKWRLRCMIACCVSLGMACGCHVKVGSSQKWRGHAKAAGQVEAALQGQQNRRPSRWASTLPR